MKGEGGKQAGHLVTHCALVHFALVTTVYWLLGAHEERKGSQEVDSYPLH